MAAKIWSNYDRKIQDQDQIHHKMSLYSEVNLVMVNGTAKLKADVVIDLASMNIIEQQCTNANCNKQSTAI